MAPFLQHFIAPSFLFAGSLMSLPENPLKCAVVYNTAVPCATASAPSCGHVVALESLMDLLDGNPNEIIKCPECKTAHVISVCDKLAAESLLGQDEDDAPLSLVCFRYGSQVYWLAVPPETTAQARIAHVLGIPRDLKILHQGKVVYKQQDEDDRDDEQASQSLLAASSNDIKAKKKPTLVVMGKRVGHWGAQGGHLHK
jgi:hypothetical protein